MGKMSKEDCISLLRKISLESSKVKVEITTFDFETINGVITKFEDTEEAVVLLEEDNGVVDEIEVDFIYDIIEL